MLPTPLLLEDRIRVFCAGCDDDLRGRIFTIDLSREFPFSYIGHSESPVLDVGAPGSFDCDGVNPSCLVIRDGELWLYYIGWHRSAGDEPYTLISGLAISKDNGLTFSRKKAPLLSSIGEERLFRTAPYVWHDGQYWCMLYIGGDTFFSGPTGKRLPIYSVRYIKSPDGLNWPDSGGELISPNLTAGEIGFGRPVLLSGVDVPNRIIVSSRTIQGYRLIEGEWPVQKNGNMAWTDVILPSNEGWDSEMICFGAPIKIGSYNLMLYNGNGFGKTGFGIAVHSEFF